MPLTLDGDDGISGIDGSAATPAIQGADSNTGISFGTDEVNVVTGGSTRTTVDASGRLLVGTTTATSSFKFGGSGDTATTAQIDGASSGRDVGLALVNQNSSDTQPVLRLAKSRGTAASPTAVNNDDYTGSIQFMGYDGTRYIDTARIDSLVNGTPGTNDMPGELIFSCTANGTSVVTPRMRLSNDGVGYVANLYNSTAWIAATSNGSSASVVVFACRRSATAVDNGTNVFFVYANGSYATISDANQKKNIESTRDGYLEDLNRLRVVKYNWNDQEDTEPRELGLIAQEVEEVFPGLVSETQTEGEDPVKGIKYSVLPVMLLKALQEADAKIEAQAAQIASLEARLTALEGGAS